MEQKPTLKAIILQILKRGQITARDGLKLSYFVPTQYNTMWCNFLEYTDTDKEKIERFKAMTPEQQRERLKDCRTPDPDTTPRQLTRRDKLLFLDMLQHGTTPANIEKLDEIGIRPAHEILLLNGSFCLFTPRDLYNMFYE